MKKTFTLTHPKIKAARLADSARCDVRRYLKRSRNRARPEGVDFWDFDCRFGPTAEEAQPIDVADIARAICDVEAKSAESFYVEILAKPGHRTDKPSPSPESDAEG